MTARPHSFRKAFPGPVANSLPTRGEMRMRYLSEIPLTIERGVLCHNIVGHSIDQRPGPYGFRAWIADKPPQGFKQCQCGWSGLPHYSARPYYQCEPSKTLPR
jgi:hypothetical protein